MWILQCQTVGACVFLKKEKKRKDCWCLGFLTCRRWRLSGADGDLAAFARRRGELLWFAAPGFGLARCLDRMAIMRLGWCPCVKREIRWGSA